MSHDDGDWDSELGEGLLDILIYTDGVISGWKITLLIFLAGAGLLLWHYMAE